MDILPCWNPLIFVSMPTRWWPPFNIIWKNLQITIDYLPRKKKKNKRKFIHLQLFVQKLTRGQVRSSKRKPLHIANLLLLEQIYMHQLISSSCLIGRPVDHMVGFVWCFLFHAPRCPLFTNPYTEYATSTTSIYIIKQI